VGGKKPSLKRRPYTPRLPPGERSKGGSPAPQGGPTPRAGGSHVVAFVQERLQKAPGSSLGSSELRAAYESWCAERGHRPLTAPKFAAELKALGYDKWKSSGRMRYRALQLVA
jgi:hypothetical protein